MLVQVIYLRRFQNGLVAEKLGKSPGSTGHEIPRNTALTKAEFKSFDLDVNVNAILPTTNDTQP
jgi:hypothetical protein